MVQRFWQGKAYRHQGRLVLFVLMLLLSIWVGSGQPLQAQLTPEQEALIEEIEQAAERHVSVGTGMNLSFSLQYPEDAALSRPKIQAYYEEEYRRLKEENKPGPWEAFRPQLLPWTLAAIAAILAGLNSAIGTWIKDFWKQTGDKLYTHLFAGNRLFVATDLRRYRKHLFQVHKDLIIPFRRNRPPLSMAEVYVPLKVAGSDNLKANQVDAYQTIATHRRLMVTGPPGSGKSMLLKHIALTYGSGRLVGLTDGTVPVLLELHRLNNPQLKPEQLIDAIVAAFGRNRFANAKQFVQRSLRQGTLLLLLDGLDEVNKDARTRIVRRINDLLKQYSQCRVIVTCRTAVYNGEFDAIAEKTLEVVEFSDQQMRRFLDAWKAEIPPDKSIDQLLQTLRDRPKILELARNPLLLTIIAYLYTDPTFVLPRSRAEFYQESTRILLGQWQQGFNKYRANDKRRVLEHLALYNQDEGLARQQDRRSISYEAVLAEIRAVLPSLDLNPGADSKLLLDDIIERSGLLLKIDTGDRYQFAHLTLQEYFAAAALLNDEAGLIERFREDIGAWREVVKLWCGLAQNSTTMIRSICTVDALTAFECLADAQEVDPTLADDIIAYFKGRLGSSTQNELLVKAFGAVAADERPRGQAVFEYLQSLLENPQEEELYKSAATALSMTNLSKAAKALAEAYQEAGESPIRTALVRLGNLAVPELAKLGKTGYSSALEALFDIATPKAAVALVPFLNRSDSTKYPAAWYLAALLPQPAVEEALQTYPQVEEVNKEENHKWIWEPFTSNEANSALPVIAGRLAFLLENTSTFDPSSIPQFIGDAIQAVDIRLLAPLYLLPTSVKVEGLPSWPEELDSFLEASSLEPSAKDYLHDMLNRLIGRNPVPSFWRVLLSYRVDPKFQLDLLRRVMLYGQPEQYHWRNLFTKVKYDFRTSWHYWGVLSIAFAFSVGAIFQMSFVIANQPEHWVNGLLGLAIWIAIVFWLTLSKGIEAGFEPSLFINLGIKGIGTFWSEWQQLSQKGLVWPGIEAIVDTGAFVGAFVVFVAIFVVAFVIGADADAFSTFVAIFVAIFATFAIFVAFSAFVTDTAARAGTRAVAVAGASTVAVAVAVAVASTVAAGAVAVAVAVAVAGAVAGAGMGIGAWYRLKQHPEQRWFRYLSLLAFPWFCWLPIVAVSSLFGVNHFLSSFSPINWSTELQTAVFIGFWLILGTLLWQWGQQLERKARNPFQGGLAGGLLEVYRPR
ncbi:MAG: NACHT domain-containing protein [Cyanobacteria bacterium J06639_14]